VQTGRLVLCVDLVGLPGGGVKKILLFELTESKKAV
jgi:hypothetical protein